MGSAMGPPGAPQIWGAHWASIHYHIILHSVTCFSTKQIFRRIRAAIIGAPLSAAITVLLLSSFTTLSSLALIQGSMLRKGDGCHRGRAQRNFEFAVMHCT